MADSDKCISCGEIIPEGRWICPVCERGGRRRQLMGYGKQSRWRQIVLVFRWWLKNKLFKGGPENGRKRN